MATVSEAPAPAVTDASDGLLHGAHLACQVGAPFVTVSCGLAFGWDEHGDGDDMPKCRPCWDATHCPLCGTPLDGGV